MKEKLQAYKPIACHLHDQIESSIVKKQSVRISFEEPGSGKVISCQTILSDWYVKEGGEYIVLGNGQHLRLDYLRSFEIVSN
ncbi:transcriptional antiterminator Rof (Rho-off) [Thermonema lapsum]|uniref:Transcriptional antiterminator Rof (Rho-off) n=1 Tax=Thermonema lapsum TaxID=28195 RepID=A0A846MMQ1_9BACT|nr:hypothetical protein [Thermonema lapsum]NIK72647.1 transcriptional antiterminator Rof (Rho-off) [Thermonema lapsum]